MDYYALAAGGYGGAYDPFGGGAMMLAPYASPAPTTTIYGEGGYGEAARMHQQPLVWATTLAHEALPIVHESEPQAHESEPQTRETTPTRTKTSMPPAHETWEWIALSDDEAEDGASALAAVPDEAATDEAQLRAWHESQRERQRQAFSGDLERLEQSYVRSTTQYGKNSFYGWFDEQKHETLNARKLAAFRERLTREGLPTARIDANVRTLELQSEWSTRRLRELVQDEANRYTLRCKYRSLRVVQERKADALVAQQRAAFVDLLRRLGKQRSGPHDSGHVTHMTHAQEREIRAIEMRRENMRERLELDRDDLSAEEFARQLAEGEARFESELAATRSTHAHTLAAISDAAVDAPADSRHAEVDPLADAQLALRLAGNVFYDSQLVVRSLLDITMSELMQRVLHAGLPHEGTELDRAELERARARFEALGDDFDAATDLSHDSLHLDGMATL